MSLSHYIELEPVPEEEMSVPQIMADIFAMIHKALAFSKEDGVGISLPHYREGSAEMPAPSLGNYLRLHGTEEALKALLKRPELQTLTDYVHIKGILPVPRETKYRTVKRIQVKSNPARLLRRSVAKGWLTEEEAKERLEKAECKRIFLPFFPAKSSTTKQPHYRVLIEHGKIQDTPVTGKFSAYGLGIADKENNIPCPTIPWF